MTHGGIKRAALEEIGGVWQGALFRFAQGLEAGINRLAWGPEGALYAGGIGSNGNWNHLGHRFGLQKLVPNERKVFEVEKMEAVRGGFLLTLTMPAPLSVLGNPASYRVEQWALRTNDRIRRPAARP